MKSLRTIAYGLCAVFFCSCSSGDSLEYSSPECPSTFTKVDYKNLVDSIEYYDNKYVEVTGFYYSGFEIAAFKGSKDKDEPTLWTGFAFEVPDSDRQKVLNKKIIARGVIEQKEHGHLGMYVAGFTICYFKTVD